MKEKCLYVTCFDEKIFNITGKECISSFLNARVEGDLLLAYEGGAVVREQATTFLQTCDTQTECRVIFHDLDANELLNNVLEQNADVIPEDYGGTNSGMNRGSVPESGLTSMGAKKYFLYRASKWWRVFAALDAAAKQPVYDYVVQIDADVVFVKPISLQKIQTEMSDNAIIFHEGEFRRNKVEEGLVGIGVETSFTAYSKKHGGYDIIFKLMDKLTTKQFRNHERWDDSFLLSHIIHNEVDFKCRDLITDQNQDTDVVERGPFRDYILHFKGMNGGVHEGIQKYNNYIANK